MNKFQRNDALSRMVGKYICQNGSVLFDQGKDQRIPVMIGIAYIDGFVKDVATGTSSYIIAIIPSVPGMEPCLVRVNQKLLSNANELGGFLGARGIVVLKPAHASRYLTESAAEAVKYCATRELVSKPGWIAGHRAFFTGGKLIASSGIDADAFWLECSDLSVMGTSGELHTWQSKIGVHIVANPIVLAMVCISMASPFLDRLNLSSFLANFFGEKGTGKTLAEQCAASVFGNGVDPAQGAQADHPAYVSRFNGTVNGYEKYLGRYSPMPILFDELTEASGPVINALCYLIASGEGKIRMLPTGEAAPRERWQSNVITSAEVSIAGKIAASGKQMLGGQADRAIDIPITESRVLTCYGSFDSFQGIAGHLKRACGNEYGTPAEAIIQYCCDNPEVVSDLLEQAPGIVDELSPNGCGDGELRVVQRLAGAVVAGRIAVMAGVFGEDAVQKIDSAIKLVVELWWGARAEALVRIRRFLHEHLDEIVEGKPDPNCEAVAFVSDELTVIPTDVFAREFGEDARRMLDELKGLGILKHQQDGRHMHRFCNGRFYGYAFLSNRIWTDEDEEEDQLAA
jgi:hypothetical protein